MAIYIPVFISNNSLIVNINLKAISLFQVGSGEIPVDEEEWEDIEEWTTLGPLTVDPPPRISTTSRRKSSLICPIYNVSANYLFKLNRKIHLKRYQSQT